MDLTRKYITLKCDVCFVDYIQQERVLTKCKWKNRCHKHRSIKFNAPKTCPDCGKIIWRDSTKCKSCSQKTHIDKYCIDCGKQITFQSKNRCLSCHNKNQNKGLSVERTKFNNSNKWNSIRNKCFIRDNHTCQLCNNRGGYLNAHHIKPYKKYPLLRLLLDNLITLCWDCHLKLHHNKEFKLNNKRYAS